MEPGCTPPGLLGSPASSGTAKLDGTVFPGIDFTSKDSSLGVAKSATLTGTTPFGEYFGTSRGQQYLTSGVASGKPEGSITLTFDTSPVPGTWGFALGDVDAEDIKLSATDTFGNPVDVRDWQFAAFNYAGQEDVPTWTQETERILGNGVDTSGASMWVSPTTEVATITLTQIKLSGFPQYQLWVAADVLTAQDVQELTVPDDTCTAKDTDLVNGGFEFPAIPAKSFRQLNQRDVLGWETSATDQKIEIWSTGFSGVVAQDGNQFAELNATQPSELYQVVETIPGETLTWSLLHRARAAGPAGDTMSVNIGVTGADPNAVYTFTDELSAGWVRHSGSYTVPAGQTQTRFGFESGATASGNKSVGNFIDDIYFTTTECIPAAVTEGNVVEPEVSPSALPTPAETPTETPTETPVERTNPATPTTIKADDIPGVPSGSTITSVDPPGNGTAKVVNGDVVYTPKDGFRGEERLTVEVLTPTGETKDVTVTVAVGKEQKVITRWTAPKKLTAGMNHFGPGTFMTNANQVAEVAVNCTIIKRWVSPNPDPDCTVVAGKEGTYIDVTVYEPTAVEVLITAPKKGKYAPMEQKYVYRVNP